MVDLNDRIWGSSKTILHVSMGWTSLRLNDELAQMGRNAIDIAYYERSL